MSNDNNSDLIRRLTVDGFSCIDHACIDLGLVNIFVGPQGSGKSVASKLIYFFYSLLTEHFLSIEEGYTISDYKDVVKQRFSEWFPPSAWGKKKFCIEFVSGAFQVKLTRVEYKGEVSDNIRVKFSPYFENQYQQSFENYKTGIDNPNAEPFEISWKVRQRSELALKKTLKQTYVRVQLFIPAGRSFFTNIGKAILAFEQSKILDPLIVRFGRIFASVRDRYSGRAFRQPHKPWHYRQMSELFGGRIVFERDTEYVIAHDGRRIPFSALSSGQQELLPLWFVLEAYSSTSENMMIYIEEPEAHLFPSAQSMVVQLLTSLTTNPKSNVSILITTHSPYVLAKINNLVKAHSIVSEFGDAIGERVSSVIPRSSWLNKNNLRAYAIKERNVLSILDEDCLIDAEYLDQISSAIAKEFSSLLGIEANESDELHRKNKSVSYKG